MAKTSDKLKQQIDELSGQIELIDQLIAGLKKRKRELEKKRSALLPTEVPEFSSMERSSHAVRKLGLDRYHRRKT